MQGRASRGSREIAVRDGSRDAPGSNGFALRRKSAGHAIATKRDGVERITLQPAGSKAKSYQVRQMCNTPLNDPEFPA
jgi:hypothetical protein